jgi:hypothetical protein
MNQSETLGIARVPHGLPLARSSVPKTHSINMNRKSTLKNTFPRKPPKTLKSKPFQRDCWSKITKQRGTRSSYMTSNKNPSKKHPQNFPTENPRRGSENHKKGKMGEAQTSLEEPHRIIYTYHERFIQGLASTRLSFPLTGYHLEALKLALRVASTQALRSRHVSFASKLPTPCDPNRSDHFPKPARPVLA